MTDEFREEVSAYAIMTPSFVPLGGVQRPLAGRGVGDQHPEPEDLSGRNPYRHGPFEEQLETINEKLFEAESYPMARVN